MRRAAPLVAKIKDREKRPEYARKLAGDLGMDLEPVQRAVAAAGGAGAPPRRPRAAAAVRPPTARSGWSSGRRSSWPCRRRCWPGRCSTRSARRATAHPVYQAVRDGDRRGRRHRVGATGGVVWIERVRDACADLGGKALVGELAVEPLRVDGEADPRYV